MIETGIYIHIPFCKQKCKYCDFVSFSNMENKVSKYIECVLKEIEEKSNSNKLNFENNIEDLIQINTIYIGGGTPSIISEEYIEKIINKIRECFKLVDNPEITIEVNPGTVNRKKLEKYFKLGINRTSIGLQSTNDELLKLLGRVHSYSDFEEVYEMARNVGFKNINVDLMIGLPTQTIEDVQKSVYNIISKHPEHVSVYSLIVEENTKMFNLIEKGELKLPDEVLERQMYWSVKSILEENGYKHYEISNFSKPTYESKHNMNCWRQRPYIGFGVAAHSYFNNMRYSNIDSIKQYIENIENGESIYNIIFHENQGNNEMMKEFMLLRIKND